MNPESWTQNQPSVFYMEQKRKYKKHTDSDRLQYMHMIENGLSINALHRRYGIDGDLLTVLWNKYKQFGKESIRKTCNIRANYEIKRKIVLDIESGKIPLYAVSFKYGASVSQIRVWLKLARSQGTDALSTEKKRGRKPVMGRPKKNSRPLTELEKLQKENQELKTEIALLKKVRALVEERNARLKEIGHGPSKS
ncbi:MAG: helix-turn-helix domain-containing protein [Prevotella sp.]